MPSATSIGERIGEQGPVRGKYLIFSEAGGGDGGIRTLGTLIEYGSLAGNWFQPLTHVSEQQRGCEVRAIIAMFASGKVADKKSCNKTVSPCHACHMTAFRTGSSAAVQPVRLNPSRFVVNPIRLGEKRLRQGVQAILLNSATIRGCPVPAKGCMMITMIDPISEVRRRFSGLVLATLAAICLAVPATAQELESVDPDRAYDAQGQAPSGGIDADLALPAAPLPAPNEAPTDPTFDSEFGDYATAQGVDAAPTAILPATQDPAATSATYGEDDLIGAAEGVFGKGAEGLARMIEDLLKKQGEPNAYIVGREAGGAFIVGARYGSGTLHHKIEGEQKVYWTGPSIGFDAGANAANTFVLVYNLYDSEELFERFPAGEGQAYFIGGLHASYLRRGDVVLIPIRVGAGLRLGINAGYMKFSKKQRWLPF